MDAMTVAAVAILGTGGPHAVVMEQDSKLPDHTVFRPATLQAVQGGLPLVAFGNGGCANIGNRFQNFLRKSPRTATWSRLPGRSLPIRLPRRGHRLRGRRSRASPGR